MHPFLRERHGLVRRSSSPEAVSFRCGCRASRPPGLRRAALRMERGLSSAASSATVSCPRAPGLLSLDEDENAPGWIRTNVRTNRLILSQVPLTARGRAHGCGRQDSNLRSSPCPASRYQEGALTDHKSAALPGCATAASLHVHGGPPLRRGRVVVRRRFLGRPPQSPRPDSNRGLSIQGRVGLSASPRGCRGPAPIRTGTPSPRTRCASDCATGLSHHTREHGPGTRRWRRPGAENPKPPAPRNPRSAYDGGTTFG